MVSIYYLHMTFEGETITHLPMPFVMSSCREKKDAEISSLEVERNKELEELRELEQGNQNIRDKMDDMARQYNRLTSIPVIQKLPSYLYYQ